MSDLRQTDDARGEIRFPLIETIEHGDDGALWRFSSEGVYLASARNKASAEPSGQRCIFCEVLLVEVGIGHINLDDEIGRRLCLSIQSVDGGGCESSAGHPSKYEFVPTHEVLLPLTIGRAKLARRKSDARAMSASLKKRTKSRHVGMSALWTYAPQQ